MSILNNRKLVGKIQIQNYNKNSKKQKKRIKKMKMKNPENFKLINGLNNKKMDKVLKLIGNYYICLNFIFLK